MRGNVMTLLERAIKEEVRRQLNIVLHGKAAGRDVRKPKRRKQARPMSASSIVKDDEA